MAFIHQEKMSAQIDGDFVIFLIGMRINKPWKIHRWWPVFYAMLKMLKELQLNRELGMLHHILGMKVIVQYWRSVDHLMTYATNNHEHLKAWREFNQAVQKSAGDVGIWHETYMVRAGEYESVYRSMPQFGLAMASSLIPATGHKDNAKGRIEDNQKRQNAS